MSKNALDRLKEDQSEQDKVFSYLQKNNLIETIIKYAIDWRGARKTVWLKPWIEEQVENATPELIQASKDAVKGLQPYDWDKKAIACLRYVKSNVRYVTDDSKWKVPEVWQEAYTTLGLRTGDCEDGAILMYVLMRLAGIPSNRMLLFAGDVLGGGHCWLVYRPVNDPLNFRFLDWCYWPDTSLVESRPSFIIVGRQIFSFQQGSYKPDPKYYNIWWAFNEDATFFGFKRTV